MFTDTVPATTTFVPGTLTTTRGTTDESGAPTLRVAVGPLRIGETVTITFRVTVNAGVPAGTVISNQGSVDSSSTVPEPTDWDGVEANGDQPTDVVVGTTSRPESPLYVQKVVALADDLVPALGTVNAGDVMELHAHLHQPGADHAPERGRERHGARRPEHHAAAGERRAPRSAEHHGERLHDQRDRPEPRHHDPVDRAGRVRRRRPSACR